MRRLNPARPSDNPMYEMLFCFGSGGNTSGGSASDFDDSYNQSMGYTGGSYDSEIERRVAAGEDARTDDAFAEAQARTSSPGAGAGADPSPAPSPADQGTFDPRISAEVMSDSPQQFDLEQMQLANDLIARSTAAANRTPVTLDRAMQKDREGYFRPGEYETDIDVFDTVYTGGATPAADVTRAAGVEQARSVAAGSPNDIRNLDRALNEESIDGGDIGDFYEFLAPEVREKADAEANVIREAVEKGESLPGEVNPLQPFGVAKNLLRNLFERDEEFARQANLPGSQFQVNDQGQITGVYNPQTNAVYTPESVGLFDLKGQEAVAGDLFAMQRQQREEELARRGDGDGGNAAAPMAAVRDPCPDGYQFNEQTQSCEYTGVAAQGATSYTGAPITQTTQYTGIGGLEPFVLRPTYTAPTSFAPSYNVNV